MTGRDPIERSWIDRWVDAAVPAALAEDDLRARPRALMLLRFAFTGAFFTAILFPYFALYLQRPLTGWMNLLYCALLGLTLVVLRRTGSLVAAAYWALTSTLSVILVQCWALGGVSALAYVWIAILPMAAMLLLGARGGVAWWAITTVALAAVGAAHLHGLIPSAPLLSEEQLVEAIVSACSLNAALTTLGWLYETRVRELVHHLEDERSMFRERSVRDPLTGLANRSLLMECLLRSRERCRRNGIRGALFFIDLDGFKAVNDGWGHAAGDRVLCLVAERLDGMLRRSDLAGRLGGDEFAIIVEGLAGSAEARALAQKLRDLIDQPFQIGDTPVHVGASIGIAFYPGDEEDPAAERTPAEPLQPELWPEGGMALPPVDSDSVEEILKRADTAMYVAKRSGGGYSIDA